MQAFSDVITGIGSDRAMYALPGAVCTVYVHGTSTLATIYADDGVTPLTNPTVADAAGRLVFYAADGRYDITVTAGGYVPYTLTDVLLEDPSSAQITGGSIDNTPVGATTPSTGTFTTLTASGNVTLGDASTDTVTVNGAMTVGNSLSVTGALSASGAISTGSGGATNAGLQIVNGSAGVGSGYGGIYAQNVTPSTSNWSFYTTQNASSSGINGSTNSILYVANSAVATATSTGLAVTGALSASGDATLTNPSTNQSSLALQDVNGRRVVIKNPTPSLPAYVGTSTNHDLVLGHGTALDEKARVSSTGLAVTGALSATGEITSGSSGVAGTLNVKASTSGASQDVVVLKALDSSNTFYANAVYYGNSQKWCYAGSTVGATLDTSGNLGLGVTPSAWGAYAAQQIQRLGLYGSAGNGGVSFNSYYDGAAWKYIGSDYATNYDQYLGQHRWYTAPSGTAGDSIGFGLSMTLDANTTLWVGNYNSLTAGGMLFAHNAGADYRQVGHATGTASGEQFDGYYYNGGLIGSITQNGTTAVAYNTTSDHRLKENVRPADAARFMDIQFRDFEWTDGRHDCGVIAHELQAVYPDLVLGAKDATEVRTVEITPAVPAVTERRLVTPAIPAVYAGEQLVTPAVEAVYEDVVITPAVPAVTEEQTFPVYQQVNYIGLIGRMGVRVQQLQRTVDAQAELIAAMEARLAALESNV